MKDTVLSIRLPSSLVKELKSLLEKEHFLDMSEQIRTIVREKCEEYSKPYQHELKKISHQMEEKHSNIKKEIEKQKLIEELNKIIKELK